MADEFNPVKKASATMSNLAYAVILSVVYGYMQLKAKGMALTTPNLAVAAAGVICTTILLFKSYGKYADNVKMELSLAQKSKTVKNHVADDEVAIHEAAVNLSHFYINGLFPLASLFFTFFMFKETDDKINLALSGASASMCVLLYSSVKAAKDKTA